MDFIEKLKSDSSFKEFIAYAFEQIDTLTEDQILKLSDKRAGEEAKLTIRCRQRLLNIFSVFTETPNKKELSEEQKKEAKNKFRM